MSSTVLLKDKPPARSSSRRRGALLAISVALVLFNLAAAGALAFHHAVMVDLPVVTDTDELWSVGRPKGLTFVDQQGRVLAHRGARHGAPVSLADLPPYVPLAFLAIEDARFYEHGAIDTRALLRATLRNLKSGRIAEGGSTLSQQLARTLFLTQERTLRRKLQETILAAHLERNLPKDALLELYLNRVYLGSGAYGLSAASEIYFDKAPKDLSLSEAALLAALPLAPSRLSPARSSAAAWARGEQVLRRMARLGWLEAADHAAAIAKPPQVTDRSDRPNEGVMTWVYDVAEAQAAAITRDGPPDLMIEVTVDPTLQARAAQSVETALASSDPGPGRDQAAVVALAPDGAVRALIGGREPLPGGFNRALQARRQPGSAFKPIVWAAALEAGVRPADLRNDAPLHLAGWRPQNFGGRHHGATTVQRALQLSLNTVSVELAREVGLEEVASLARRFGLAQTPQSPGASLALGAYEVTPLELAAAYQVLQSGGRQSRPYLVKRITDARGQVLYLRRPEGPIPIYPEFEAAQMVQMMQAVVREGTGRAGDFGRPAAGKTGTSQAHRDAWFAGFTPEWLCVVWVGRDDGSPMPGMTGSQSPARIWRDVMGHAHRGLPVGVFRWFPSPAPAALSDATLRALEKSQVAH